MKPTNLSIIVIPPVSIGITIVEKLEIDLTHINYGLDPETKKYKKKARSNFSEIEVANIFESFNGFFLSPSGKKDNYLYFAYRVEYHKREYMLAFCINKESIKTAGIITLYKIK